MHTYCKVSISQWQSGILIEVADARLWPRSVLVMIFMIESEVCTHGMCLGPHGWKWEALQDLVLIIIENTKSSNARAFEDEYA